MTAPQPGSLLERHMRLTGDPVDTWISYGALCVMHYDVDANDRWRGWAVHTFQPLSVPIPYHDLFPKAETK